MLKVNVLSHYNLFMYLHFNIKHLNKHLQEKKNSIGKQMFPKAGNGVDAFFITLTSDVIFESTYFFIVLFVQCLPQRLCSLLHHLNSYMGSQSRQPS